MYFLGTNYGAKLDYTNPVDTSLVSINISSNRKDSNPPKSVLDRAQDTFPVIPRVATENKQNVSEHCSHLLVGEKEERGVVATCLFFFCFGFTAMDRI